MSEQHAFEEERASNKGTKVKHGTHSIKKGEQLGFLEYQIVSNWRSPSTAAMTTRSIDVSVAVVILYLRGKAKNSVAQR